MVRHFLLIVLLVFPVLSFSQAQNVGIGTTTPHNSALLDMNSINKGFLPPRMTSAQRIAIANPSKGLMVFDNTTASYWYFGDGTWKEITGGGTSSDSTIMIGDPNPGPLSQYLVSMGGGGVFDTSGIVFDSGGEFGNYGNNEDHELNIYSSLAFNALGVKVTIQQMNLENINDTVVIASSYQKRYFTGNVAPQQFVLNGIGLQIKAISNGSVVAAGFKIRFDFIFPPIQQSAVSQISGWTYLPSKLAVRGGFDAENSSPDSIGVLSFGYGRGVLAKGNYSIAMGDFVAATGINSVALGSFSKASGSLSFAFGESAEARGSQSIALGYRAEAIGNYSVAIGYTPSATGGASFAVNNNTQAIGSSSSSFGASTRAHGSTSIAMGNNTESFGTGSVAMGSFTNAYGTYSLALGSQTNAVGNSSVAAGDRSRSTGVFSIATGKETVASSYTSFTIGQYNDSIAAGDHDTWVVTDPAFIIGNGTSNSSRRNAFIVTKEGKTGLNLANGTPQALLHLKGALPSSYDSHIRLETAGALTDYSTLVYDGDMKFRNFGAGDNFQWRVAGGSTVMSLSEAGNLNITGVLSQNSDSRLKKNISPLQNSLQKVLALSGYQYNWIEDSRDKNIQTGVLAQEVEKQMPELVTTDSEGIKSVNYSGMIPYLIESIKELKKENEELRKEILLIKKNRN